MFVLGCNFHLKVESTSLAAFDGASAVTDGPDMCCMLLACVDALRGLACTSCYSTKINPVKNPVKNPVINPVTNPVKVQHCNFAEKAIFKDRPGRKVYAFSRFAERRFK